MKILISPAKLLDFENTIKTPEQTIAQFIDKADFLAKKLYHLSADDLSELMNISKDLAEVNYQRYKDWEKPVKLREVAQPAITVFNGEVYKGLDVATFSAEDFKKAQNTLRILSGLYGILKPMDLMYPYRLEMGTKWKISEKENNLYDFWKPFLADYLLAETSEDEVIINLASNEYFKAIDKKKLNRRVITPVFKELRGDKFKVIMMYAKHARGAMARDIIQNEYKSPEDLKAYNVDGYSFSEEMSKGDEWVFIR